jgi:hypothetical protein
MNFIAKARANRLAALEHITDRKSKLISLNDFRSATTIGQNAPVMGFVSTRAAVEDNKFAA